MLGKNYPVEMEGCKLIRKICNYLTAKQRSLYSQIQNALRKDFLGRIQEIKPTIQKFGFIK